MVVETAMLMKTMYAEQATVHIMDEYLPVHVAAMRLRLGRAAGTEGTDMNHTGHFVGKQVSKAVHISLDGRYSTVDAIVLDIHDMGEVGNR